MSGDESGSMSSSDESYDDSDKDSDFVPTDSDSEDTDAEANSEGEASDGNETNIRPAKAKPYDCTYGLGDVLADLRLNGPLTGKKKPTPKDKQPPKKKKKPAVNMDELPDDEIPYEQFSQYSQEWTEEAHDVHKWKPDIKPPPDFPEGGGSPFDATLMKSVEIFCLMLGPAIKLWRKETYRYAMRYCIPKNFPPITKAEGFVWIAIYYAMGLSNKSSYDVGNLIKMCNILI